jgi:hypothetical protein
VVFSTRTGGVSDGAYASLNLGFLSGESETRERQRLRQVTPRYLRVTGEQSGAVGAPGSLALAGLSDGDPGQNNSPIPPARRRRQPEHCELGMWRSAAIRNRALAE